MRRRREPSGRRSSSYAPHPTITSGVRWAVASGTQASLRGYFKIAALLDALALHLPVYRAHQKGIGLQSPKATPGWEGGGCVTGGVLRANSIRIRFWMYVYVAARTSWSCPSPSLTVVILDRALPGCSDRIEDRLPSASQVPPSQTSYFAVTDLIPDSVFPTERFLNQGF